MKTRKTVEVRAILDRANTYLAEARVNADVLAGYCTLLESVLYLANAYAGFGYIAPGYASRKAEALRKLDFEKPETVEAYQRFRDESKRNGDEYRRVYYTHKKLQ
jgi:hypothetical protein